LTLGRHRLPATFALQSAFEVADFLGDAGRFHRAAQRYAECVERWVSLRANRRVLRHFEVFADHAEVDFRRLLALPAWLEHNPRSGLAIREIPIVGLDTKVTVQGVA